MLKNEVPEVLLNRIARANANGAGYIIPESANAIWHKALNSLTDTGHIEVLGGKNATSGAWLRKGKTTPNTKSRIVRMFPADTSFSEDGRKTSPIRGGKGQAKPGAGRTPSKDKLPFRDVSYTTGRMASIVRQRQFVSTEDARATSPIRGGKGHPKPGAGRTSRQPDVNLTISDGRKTSPLRGGKGKAKPGAGRRPNK